MSVVSRQARSEITASGALVNARHRRALHRGIGNAPRDVDDVGRTADTEQCAEHAAEETRRRCPRSPQEGVAGYDGTGTVIGDAPNPVTPNTE